MKNERDLFYEIQNVLHTHEDAYVPGAWEEFVKKKKRRRGLVYIRLAAAAAVLLFLGYAALFFNPSAPVDKKTHQTKKTKPPYIYPKHNPGHDSLIADQTVVPQKNDSGDSPPPIPLGITRHPVVNAPVYSPGAIKGAPVVTGKPEDTKKPAVATNIAEVVLLKKDSTNVANVIQPSNNTSAKPVVTSNVPPVVNTEPKRYERGSQRLNYDSLANLNKPKPFAADEKKSKNLSYALLVSPSVGNQKMNFGTGVEVAYNINKNFSVSSGIAYAYVNAGSNRTSTLDATQNRSLQGYNASFSTSAPASNTLTLDAPRSSQSVKGVKLALSGLEIPLSFQYKTKGGFFVNAGVSAMSVIGNNLSYNLINNRTVSSGNGLAGAGAISVITEESTEKSNEKINGYVGFYTLSAGKKINFGRGKLNFAPFIKIPFNRISSENIQLMHGGVQLGFGF